MGEMKVLSSFGEEFVAEIEVYGVDPKDPDIEDFYNVYIEPVPDSLSNIHEYIKNINISFRKAGGKVKLLLSHPDYYSEPYIEFTVFLSSGNININRAFTALIDIPQVRVAAMPAQPESKQPSPGQYYRETETTAAPLQWQQTTGTRIVRPGETLYTIAREIQRRNGGDMNRIMETVFSVNRHAFINNDRNLIMAGSQITIPEGTEIQQVSEPLEVADIDRLDDYGPVPAGDTLFRIARRYQSSYDESVPELADRIFSLNPHAFIRNDINLLRQGVMLKLPPQEQMATEEMVEKTVTGATPTAEEVSEDRLEILVPTDKESPGEISGVTEEKQLKEKLEDTMVDLEDVVRENSELKNSVEVSKKQINVLQQQLDESNTRIEEMQGQIDELKNQAGTAMVPAPSDKPESGTTATTSMDNLVKKFNEYPWTVLLIIIVVGTAFVVLIILINNMRAVEIEPEQKDFEFRERVPDNELKARIKQKLSQREIDAGEKTGRNPFNEEDF